MHKIIEQVCDQYLNPRNAWMYEREVHRAMDEFLGSARNMPLPEAALPFFADWFVFDYPIFGTSTPLMRFHEINPLGLPLGALNECKRIIDANRYDFFEVIHNQRGSIRVRGVRSAEEFDIVDRAMECPVGDVFLSRIINAGECWQIASIDPIGLPSPSKRDKARMKNEFPALDPRVVYHEIVVIGEADLSIPVDIDKLADGQVMLTGGYAHADDGCPVCVVLLEAKRENRVPTEKELNKAFKEANKRDSHEK